MLLSPRVKLLVAFWATAEALVFLAVVHVVGLGGALLAGLAATFLGGWLLKRTGAAAVLRLRATLSGRGESAPGEILDGTVRALAAMALLLPGFLSDAIGLALAIPAVRAAAIRKLSGRDWHRRFGEPGSRRGSTAIDLASDEWSVSPPPGTPRR